MAGSIYRNLGDSGSYAPFLLDVQASLLASLDTRVVVPLVHKARAARRAGRLHPSFTVEGAELVMATELIAAVSRASLGNAVGDLAGERDTFLAAIDVLFSGV